MLEHAADQVPGGGVPAPRDLRLASHRAFRDSLVDGLRRQLFGPAPDDDDDARSELLIVSPLQLYATGVLFPQKIIQSLLEDDQQAEDGHAAEDVGGDFSDPQVREAKRSGGRSADEGSTSDEREPLNLANEFSPSACGISFRLNGPAKLSAVVTFGTYATTKHIEPRERAGETGMDGRIIPATREVPAYRRTHHRHLVPVIVGAVFGKQAPILVDPSDPEIKLHVTVRPGESGSLVVSAMVVNHRSVGMAAPANDDCYFQTAIEIREGNGAAVFLPIDRDSGDLDDAEMASLELLYRHRRAFALGHGVAGDWNAAEAMSERGLTDRVSSAALANYELQPIRAREHGFGEEPLQLSMAFLAEGEGERPDEAILDALRRMAADYLLWIDKIERSLSLDLSAKLRDAAQENLANCRRCHARMLDGVRVLEADPQTMLAFRLMNRAMLVQQFHSSLDDRPITSLRVDPPTDYRGLPKGKGHWRPFQLAFVLMNVAGMMNPDHPERRLVDLIWFPTGGGKTEAYLGLTAFTVCLGRLRDAPAGVVVLMRYTLRLLTAQQFQRASSLILALEHIRRTRYLGADLGQDEISIGLWVGEGLSPNRRADAKRSLDKLKQRERYATNPFQVLVCPWCAVELDNPDKLGYVSIRSQNSTDRTVRFRCPDENCPFGDAAGMPVLVVDDEIYAAPPTLLIGTVDKFAQIAWSEDAGRLFGLHSGAPPPSLVIQDELHLISGPLGTIVGLYETAIDRMCSRDGHVHKIVASTATIRRAAQQCRDLYDREAFEFPPQAVRAGESYFAYEDREAPGRKYVGFLGSAVKSHQTALVRACAPLLQFANIPIAETDEAGQAVVDPYGTLVWYFNSLRELGHAATLSVGDIPEFIKGLRHRLGIHYRDSRYIREIVELTSRCEADEIPEVLKQLKVPWRRNPTGQPPVDVLLATNMIAVGVDVPRLGLLVMSGQPKSTAEYIQATSRVGRNVPGLVVTVYTQTKSRDRSHYERFVAYHQSLYRHVEPTSVTPFSPQARERGMRGVLIALARQRAGVENPAQISDYDDAVEEEVEAILMRVRSIDAKELDAAASEIADWLSFWRQYRPAAYGRMGGKVADTTLAYPFGGYRDEEFQRDAWPVPTSMRNVDGTSEARVLNVYDIAAEDAEEI
ncbi:helicase-related protein [Mesorhizobium sp. M0684]|uniref:helicase-related protein n=1 Tax=unclassified Mesorhizobium TaxID=325217 RepID=UPI00333928DF